LEKESGGKMFVGTFYFLGLSAHPMSMITTVGKHLGYSGMKTGGKTFVGHLGLLAFSPRIMITMIVLVVVVYLMSTLSPLQVEEIF